MRIEVDIFEYPPRSPVPGGELPAGRSFGTLAEARAYADALDPARFHSVYIYRAERDFEGWSRTMYFDPRRAVFVERDRAEDADRPPVYRRGRRRLEDSPVWQEAQKVRGEVFATAKAIWIESGRGTVPGTGTVPAAREACERLGVMHLHRVLFPWPETTLAIRTFREP